MKSKKTDDYIKYKKEQKKYAKMCKKDRNKAWNRYIDGIKEAKDIARLSKLLNSAERNKINVFETPDCSTTEPGEETLDELLKLSLIHI